MFKKSDGTAGGFGSAGADTADHKSLNAEPAAGDSYTTRQSQGDKKGMPAMIGASIRIKGELSGEEDLVIQGHVEGTIEVKKNNLTVGAQGSVKANVRARIIAVEGKVEGDLNGEERIVIKQSGDVRGNIVAPRVSLEDGAKFKGSIDMEPKAGKGNGASVDTHAAEKSTQQAGQVSSARNHKDSSPAGSVHAKAS
jgi:cytoskeletal protein CcmA (bactofilin family)